MQDDVMFLLRSKLRIQILEALKKEELTPVMLAKLLDKPRPSISRIVKDLESRNLAKCLNPDDDRWREYVITSKGKNVLTATKRFT